MEKCVKKLSSNIVCRDLIIKKLYSLLSVSNELENNTEEEFFNSIFIYGQTGTGKSLILESLVEYFKYNVSIVNCIEHGCSNKNMFEQIILDLSNTSLTMENGYKIERKCDSMLSFINHLRDIAEGKKEKMVIIFDKAERFRSIDNKILHAFLRLKELAKVNIQTIFVSNICWEKFRPPTGLFEPVVLYFPPYKQKEILKILALYKPKDEFGENFYANYLNLFLSVFYRFCRDLNELLFMAEKNYVKYIEPIISGVLKVNDHKGLWSNIQKVLKSNLEVLYIRMSEDDFKQEGSPTDLESTRSLALSFELPYYGKYLLIASFLASYNPPKADRKLFVRLSSKKKKRATVSKKPIKMNIHTGPKPFALTRMLQIFTAIVEEKVDINAVLLGQIPTMCRLGLLCSVGDDFDELKYKCRVNFDFICIISRNVGFEIQKYLYDYIQ